MWSGEVAQRIEKRFLTLEDPTTSICGTSTQKCPRHYKKSPVHLALPQCSVLQAPFYSHVSLAP